MLQRNNLLPITCPQQIKSVAGNYYPVTTMISVEDDKKKMFIVVDRPQGGASLRSGEIELMVSNTRFQPFPPCTFSFEVIKDLFRFTGDLLTMTDEVSQSPSMNSLMASAS